MSDLPEYVGALPNICGAESQIASALSASRGQPVFRPESRVDFGGIKSAFAIALHMHQPLIPAGGSDLRTAEIISNLKHMMDNPGIGDNHNASVFHWCYKRMGEFIPQLVDEGKQPRVMLEYSGTLLHGLRQMGLNDVFDNLKRITCDPRYRPAVEWLGAAVGARRWRRPRRSRISGCTSAPGDIISRRSSDWRRSAACAASRPPRWRCPTTRTWPMNSSRPSRIAATSGSWCRSTRSSDPRTATGRSASTCRTAWSAATRAGEEATIIAIIKTQGSDTKLVAPDAALLRGQGPFALGTRRQTRCRRW